MILVHSRQPSPDEIERFVHRWDSETPIAVVPTSYPEFNEERARQLDKVRMLIYGNHAVRAAVTAMQQVFARVIADGGIHRIDRELVPVSEIFRLQDMEEARADEKRFLR